MIVCINNNSRASQNQLLGSADEQRFWEVRLHSFEVYQYLTLFVNHILYTVCYFVTL